MPLSLRGYRNSRSTAMPSSFISASLCAVLPNVRIMEIDIDDVPWKDELTTNTPEIANGHMKIPTRPGWGTDLNEEAVKAHLKARRMDYLEPACKAPGQHQDFRVYVVG